MRFVLGVYEAQTFNNFLQSGMKRVFSTFLAFKPRFMAMATLVVSMFMNTVNIAEITQEKNTL